jgi:hypothetical protein
MLAVVIVCPLIIVLLVAVIIYMVRHERALDAARDKGERKPLKEDKAKKKKKKKKKNSHKGPPVQQGWIGRLFGSIRRWFK